MSAATRLRSAISRITERQTHDRNVADRATFEIEWSQLWERTSRLRDMDVLIEDARKTAFLSHLDAIERATVIEWAFRVKRGNLVENDYMREVRARVALKED